MFKLENNLLTRYNFYFLWVKIKKINIVYHFPQYESWRIVLCHYDLCWFLVVYGFDKSTWTWSGKTVLFRGRSWKSPLEHQRRCQRLKNNMKRKYHGLLSSTGPPIALGYATMNMNKWCIVHTAKNSWTKLGLGSKNIFGLVCTDSV